MEFEDGRRVNGVAALRYAQPVGVHRSTATVIRPVPVTLQTGVRHPRAQNEYVDSPPTEGQRSTTRSSRSTSKLGTVAEQRPCVTQNEEPRRNQVFTSQPKPSIKPPAGPTQEAETHEEDDSIICKHCGKCRCQKCEERRELPSFWLCNKKCHLSADSALEACTCLCVVQCCFYHVAKDHQMDSDVMCTDDPCACCSRPHCCKRWMCMAVMSLCIPCLCCYWPAKWGIKACTACYNRCTNKGCQCSRSDKKGSQNKRLLESDSSSA